MGILTGIVYTSDSQPEFRGTLGHREHFLGVPRDVEITNVFSGNILRRIICCFSMLVCKETILVFLFSI